MNDTDLPGLDGVDALEEALHFDNRFTRETPGDPAPSPGPRQVSAAWSPVQPAATTGPSVLAYSPEVLADLGIDEAIASTTGFAAVMSGNAALEGMVMHAANYGGHQFGNWAGQLGDGRAISLGEVVGADDERHTLQLKGAGPTPYSRAGDGRAVLRSSLREFLCSEAMHHLGVPTTRALSLSLTGDLVMRDMFYDGNPEPEPGAVVCRTAPSFIRFGTFEIFASRNDVATLKQVADHTIATHFPELGGTGPQQYLDWYREIVRRTAALMVHWQRVGFVHGVMNTDNMSIHGLTIDYGPYGWLEGYDPDWTPNTTDAAQRRYRYGEQPAVAQWNLARLAKALSPLIEDDEALQGAFAGYVDQFNEAWPQMMGSKMGIAGFWPDRDHELLGTLLDVLPRIETDMTIFFRNLADVAVSEGPEEPDDDTLLAPLMDAYYEPEALVGEVRDLTLSWLRSYRLRVRADGRSDAERGAAMDKVNPLYVPRNYLAQLAIDDAAGGDTALLNELLDTFRHPYDDQPDRVRFAERRPEWARDRPGCSMLSCSS